MSTNLAIMVHLNEDEALAYAEFLKRVMPEDYERRAGNEKEAADMYRAGLAIKAALREKGYDPR